MELVELAKALASISPAGIDTATKNRARERVLDTLGAVALGFSTPEGQALRRYAQRLGREASSAAARCRLLVGAARTTEIDDIDLGSCTTVGAVIVPVALCVAAARADVDGERALSGVVAGYEAMTRLGRAIHGATLLYRGVWPTYVTAAFGAAATAAKIIGADARTTAWALALALARTAPLPAGAATSFGFRYYSLGCAAAEGVDAAFAAAAGVEADLDGLAAFMQRIGTDLNKADLVADFGEPWRVHAVDTKPWPTSRQALASVAAFRELLAKPVAVEHLERIVVDVPPAYRNMIDRGALPAQRLESMLGVQYQLGLAAFAPDTLFDALRASMPADRRIAALMGKVVVQADNDLGERFPHRWGSRVTLRDGSGREATAEVLEPWGSGGSPLDDATLVSKLERIFGASGLRRDAEIARLAERCRSIGSRHEGRVSEDLLALTEALASHSAAERQADTDART